ncbi:cation-translocating P-type ATPase [Nitrosospira multiformis]|uniref:Plasma-membrane calcium-translocating P-type ATPase/potassium and/or sodium efflux P-type ATPase,TIGR01523 n=1 Tax=Nitrosospira multiformis TaxID=1231 RepID=A0A1I7H0W8_9PROT|nr:cation-translocating P-type ATPase [Nitrosospira multiformis]SFU54327.1 plasma-membrane calcium-translocating P-type ATPase/potassium and/or sodium efflux P-type ATPase,TIGR01523 [Nitrosospira multiformis]
MHTSEQNKKDSYQQSIQELASAYETNTQLGLSDTEALARLDRYGRNELPAGKVVPRWQKFLAQFQNVLVILLLIATAISAGLWLYERESALPYEAIAIFAVVLLNAIMGYIQESRAEEAVAALRQMSAARAKVIRGGVQRSVVATELVPGDIILVEEGDTIPADARLIQTTALQTTEAALTGESLPVSKDTELIMEQAELGDRHNMIFSGTAVTFGHAHALVVAIGEQTQMGHIAGMLATVPPETTLLQKELAHVGKLLGIIVMAIAVIMITTIILVGNVSSLAVLIDVLILGVALAVAAIPEGLPAVVTAVLALGVQRMARRNAIVRHLPAVETLGSATIIASDKTGTLTKNEMTVRVVVTASGRIEMTGTGYSPKGEVRRYSPLDNKEYPDNLLQTDPVVIEEDKAGGRIEGALRHEFERALTIADRASNAVLQHDVDGWRVQGDPTEGALIVAARKAGVEADALDEQFERVSELPFSSERKLMTTLHVDAKKRECLLVFTKGAPDALLAHCSFELVGEETRSLTPERRGEILKLNEELATEALRSLGVAFRSVPSDAFKANGADESIEYNLVFVGLIGMIDPPREEAKNAVSQAKAAGIRPIMITGDHPVTATVIAAQLGIAGDKQVVTGAKLEQLSDKELDRTVQEVSVYARVNPEHKLWIVKALQRGGEVIAMTGDGVNDAPALKTSDIGVAMGITGTDVSREAADMVLTDDNFASIVAAVEEGRTIFSNIRKFLRYLLSSNIGEVLVMFFGVLLANIIGLQTGDGLIVLPLLATQLLWVNLVTDGAPALALGVDPAGAHVMRRPPRAKGERVITSEMWFGIAFVGVIMAVGTLLVIDACLPQGLIEGSGSTPYAQTMAFNTLVLFSLFNVLNARSDKQSAFVGLFSNKWLWSAILLSLLLQIAVIYVPFLQHAFSTVSLSLRDWLLCAGVASCVLWLRELSKLIQRAASQASRSSVAQQP